ncbi:thioredoxin fold domain-containing protein [Cysteiniphilum litorale]|uniref:thioredoxin fold domain-containing protein n=1 Tax=Cysteiniphilum litorale TaxID=2056700 RepID=UPI003F88410A
MMNCSGIFKKAPMIVCMLASVFMHSGYAASPIKDAVTGYQDAINDRQQVIVTPDSRVKLSKDHSGIEDRITPIIGKLKQVFTYLTISDIKPLNINGFYQLTTNSGIIDVSTTGEVLLKAKHYLLFNTDKLDLSKSANLIQLIENNTHLQVIDHNDKGAYNYFLIDKATGITNKNPKHISEVIVGLYTTVDELMSHKDEMPIAQHKNVLSDLENDGKNNDQDNANHQQGQAQKKLKDAIIWAKHNLTYQSKLKKQDGTPLKGTLYVFTDYTCPHCRDLHEHINELLDNGYSVIYLPLPRKGLNTTVAQNMQKAICATHPLKALNALYSKGLLPDDIKEKSNCTVDVSSYYEWAKEINVTGTPYIIGSNGRTTSGFTSSGSVVDKLGMR